MSLYTKTGDDGTTSLFGGKRVLKSNFQIEVYGSLDELSSFIGLVENKTKDKNIKKILTQIQKDLYQIILNLTKNNQKNHLENQIKKFEQIIDNYEKELPKLNRFILPSGTELSCWFHVLRTICRRTERNTVKLFSQSTINNQQLIIIKYLNRLSDLFFILARYYNRNKETLI